MMGRADKGIIMTTGTFTKDAKGEAVRDGVPPIELVNGEKLLDTGGIRVRLAAGDKL
jgi:restriction system protein